MVQNKVKLRVRARARGVSHGSGLADFFAATRRDMKESLSCLPMRRILVRAVSIDQSTDVHVYACIAQHRCGADSDARSHDHHPANANFQVIWMAKAVRVLYLALARANAQRCVSRHWCLECLQCRNEHVVVASINFMRLRLTTRLWFGTPRRSCGADSHLIATLTRSRRP
jgi:hypothetical protein